MIICVECVCVCVCVGGGGGGGMIVNLDENIKPRDEENDEGNSEWEA